MKLNYSVSEYGSFFLIPEPDKFALGVTADGFPIEQVDDINVIILGKRPAQN